ncbi:hypothetical protein JT358_07090 [Micrococcales bacterium 31B]|nr:hypothetical protein [Micrococcales bacterium 31B]
MEFLKGIFVVIHLVCMAIVIGNWLTNLRAPRFAKGVWHAAAGSFVSGLILVGLATAAADPLNHVKIGVKAVVAILVVTLAFLGDKQGKRGEVSRGVFTAVGAGALLNVLLAVLWT